MGRSFSFDPSGKTNFTFNQCAVEIDAEIIQADKIKVLLYLDFNTVCVGTFGILIRVGKTRAAIHCICPFYRVLEVLIEKRYRYQFTRCGIKLITQVNIVDICSFKVGVTLHVAGKVEIIVNRR